MWACWVLVGGEVEQLKLSTFKVVHTKQKVIFCIFKDVGWYKNHFYYDYKMSFSFWRPSWVWKLKHWNCNAVLGSCEHNGVGGSHAGGTALRTAHCDEVHDVAQPTLTLRLSENIASVFVTYDNTNCKTFLNTSFTDRIRVYFNTVVRVFIKLK